MSNDTTTQSADTKSTFPHLSWQVRTPLLDNLLAVFLLMLMTPSIASLVLIWPSADMLHKGRESVSTQAESVASTLRSEAEKCNTQVLYHSSKSLRQLSDAALKMAFAVEARLVHFPIWHQEIEDILVLKNNKGTEDNRVRKLDYSIQISKLLLRAIHYRWRHHLILTSRCPRSLRFFWDPDFDDLYTHYESDGSIPKKTIGGSRTYS